MPSNEAGDTTKEIVPRHLLDKRDELIWSLAAQQDYAPVDIARIFNIRHRSTVLRIIARKPERWISPWVKRDAASVDGGKNG